MAASGRRVIHAWVRHHAEGCSWRDAADTCTCAADLIEVEAEFRTPNPDRDRRGFVTAARRAVIAGAIAVARQDDD